jgi:hypothetical protein
MFESCRGRSTKVWSAGCNTSCEKQVAAAGAQNLSDVRSRPIALLAVMVMVPLAACGGGDAQPEPAALAPQFAPDATTSLGTAPPAQPVDPSATTTPPSGSVATSSVPSAPATTAAVMRSAITDRRGDATPAVGDSAPAWADLAGAVLTTVAQGLELRVTLGSAAPDSSPDDDHTMNIAAFFDVDGDGALDYEVWANLAAGGWGGAWYDDRAGTATFLDESRVTVGVEAGVLVIRFPADHVGGATTFRWSVASEWGRHATIGTVAAARDDAPDDDGAVAFPA